MLSGIWQPFCLGLNVLDSDLCSISVTAVCTIPWEKNWPPWLLTVTSWWVHGDQNGHSQPWPGPWLSCDLAVTEPWLSCDLAVTELWPSRDWAVTSPWPSLAVTESWSLGPGAVTTVVTVSSRWPFIFSWVIYLWWPIKSLHVTSYSWLTKNAFNSMGLGAAYIYIYTCICISIGSALLQVMAWYMIGTKPLYEQNVTYCQLDPWKQTSMKL